MGMGWYNQIGIGIKCSPHNLTSISNYLIESYCKTKGKSAYVKKVNKAFLSDGIDADDCWQLITSKILNMSEKEAVNYISRSCGFNLNIFIKDFRDDKQDVSGFEYDVEYLLYNVDEGDSNEKDEDFMEKLREFCDESGAIFNDGTYRQCS